MGALLILGPCLFAAFAFEHADRPAGDRVEHTRDLYGLLAADDAGPDGTRIKTGKDLILEIAVHCDVLPFWTH